MVRPVGVSSASLARTRLSRPLDLGTVASSLESHFQVVFKNIPTFYNRTHMTKVMADKSLSTIFFRHPVHFMIHLFPGEEQEVYCPHVIN